MSKKIKVLVVDDSAFARATISRTLDSDPDIEVVGVAQDGVDAVEKVKSLRPGVVTLDVVMPRMDGLTALKHIMAECPTPVVMASALTGEQTQSTIEALALGAVDFFVKASRLQPAETDGTSQSLAGKVKLAAQVNLREPGTGVKSSRIHPQTKPPSERRSRSLDRMVVIGSSTGGPQALFELIPALPGDISAALLVVQHMPAGFTRSMAERLDQLSRIIVREAEPGDRAKPGLALVAPGDYHMTVSQGGVIELNQGPPMSGVRPSVDVTMESAASVYGASTVGVVLTGMGSDGTRGAGLIRASGGKVVVEDQSTCVVYGMPKSIVESGNADRIAPLPEMASAVIQLCNERYGAQLAG